jgi:4-oxalocrotonate tautomerase
MPEVYIHIVEGRTIDQKRQVVKDVTDAVARGFDVAPDTILIEIVEASKNDKAKGGVLFSDR